MLHSSLIGQNPNRPASLSALPASLSAPWVVAARRGNHSTSATVWGTEPCWEGNGFPRRFAPRNDRKPLSLRGGRRPTRQSAPRPLRRGRCPHRPAAETSGDRVRAGLRPRPFPRVCCPSRYPRRGGPTWPPAEQALRNQTAIQKNGSPPRFAPRNGKDQKGRSNIPAPNPASASEASGAEREAESITNFGPMIDQIPIRCHPVRSEASARKRPHPGRDGARPLPSYRKYS